MDYKYADIYVKLGLNIVYYRKQMNLTQEKLAEKIGVARNHIGNIENARTSVSLDVLFSLAEAFDIPPYKLFVFPD